MTKNPEVRSQTTPGVGIIHYLTLQIIRVIAIPIRQLAEREKQSLFLDEVAAMKIHAIEDRGTRRDFVDIYFLSKKYTLEDMLGFYQKKYSVLENHLYSILRALDYFEDAEQESQTPKMMLEVNWNEIKEYFRKETRLLIGEKLQ